MKLIYTHPNGEEEVLTHTVILTNQSMSVETFLTLTAFDMEEWARENDIDYDYNALSLRM